MMLFGLNNGQFDFISKQVFEPLKKAGAKIWVFGSRARGDHKTFSDLDVLFDPEPNRPLPAGFLAEIREQLEESRFPYKVDLVNVQELAESYAPQVQQERIEI